MLPRTLTLLLPLVILPLGRQSRWLTFTSTLSDELLFCRDDSIYEIEDSVTACPGCGHPAHSGFCVALTHHVDTMGRMYSTNCECLDDRSPAFRT